jgi:hypothetical protein
MKAKNVIQYEVYWKVPRLIFIIVSMEDEMEGQGHTSESLLRQSAM